MKNISVLGIVPALLGIIAVVQAGLNRKIASQWGLPAAVLLNSIVLLALSALLFGFLWLRGGNATPPFQIHFAPEKFSYWFLFPGLLGLGLVVGGPWCIAKWGASYTFILLIAAQLATSLIWDWKIENLPIESHRLIGVGVTWMGVLIACWKKS
jgi:transporter family-2 protein